VNLAVSVNNRIVSIVEDDSSNMLFFHEALKDFSGITTVTFIDPVRALEHFQDYEYAYVLVISDFTFNGLDCMEFLKKVKDLNPFVRTILITAALRIDDKLLREYTKKKIINGFVQKPVGLHDFLKEVDTQIQSYEIQRRYPS